MQADLDQLVEWADKWQMQFNYPILAQLATVFLGMSAGSVPVESMFSITGLMLNSRRSQLAPSKLHKLTFLHDNVQQVIDALND